MHVYNLHFSNISLSNNILVWILARETNTSARISKQVLLELVGKNIIYDHYRIDIRNEDAA